MQSPRGVLLKRPATLLKEALAQVFSCEIYEISKKTFSHRTPSVAASEITIEYLKSDSHLPKFFCLLFVSMTAL